MENQVIVLDNGTFECKIGFAGNDGPSCCVQTIIGTRKKKSNLVGMMHNEHFFGFNAQAQRGILNIQYPIENGIINDWESMEKIWQYIYDSELQILSETCPILISEPPNNPREQIEKKSQIFFEQFNVPKFQYSQTGMLCLYSVGRTTGLCFELGEGVTSSVPIFEGTILSESIIKSNISGRTITEWLQKQFQEKELKYEIVREIKESNCYVALDFDASTIQGNECDVNQKSYDLPDGSSLILKNERFQGPEVLFNPKSFQIDGYSLQEIISQSIHKSDIDVRKDLYQNICIFGGSSLLPGFQERLSKELVELVSQKVNKKIYSMPQRKYSCFIGGSILASLSSFGSSWITKAEYDEAGPSIVHEKQL